jgi:2-polyprenyl-6-methoxyphenol hydroxylase-like FAD-dependent oxidoreductase
MSERYQEPNPATTQHAIVIGAGMAGLMAAKALLNHFSHVTLVERDTLPKEPDFRQGVPQARHGHVLLSKGQQILEQLFPGIDDEMATAGIPRIDWGKECSWLGMWGWLPHFESDLQTYLCSRIRLEWMVRQQLVKQPRLMLLEQCQIDRLLVNEAGSRVTGVVVRQQKQPEMQLIADLVVDTSGRNSSLPKWLKQMRYSAPTETKVTSFLGYASRWYERPTGYKADWKLLVIMAKPMAIKRGGMLLALEDDRWLLTLSGANHDYPPTDDAGFLDFARSLRSPLIYEAIKDAKPISPIYPYHRTENSWRHYEALDRFPDGIVVLGDAVCGFNPIYGQGMSTAALSVQLLDQLLQNHQGDRVGFSQKFQRELAQMLKDPWLMATSEDFRWDETEGEKPSLMTRFMHRYMDQVAKLALFDEEVYQTFVEVIHMLRSPSSLMHPKIALRVLRVLLQPSKDDSPPLQEQLEVGSKASC